MHSVDIRGRPDDRIGTSDLAGQVNVENKTSRKVALLALAIAAAASACKPITFDDNFLTNYCTGPTVPAARVVMSVSSVTLRVGESTFLTATLEDAKGGLALCSSAT